MAKYTVPRVIGSREADSVLSLSCDSFVRDAARKCLYWLRAVPHMHCSK